VPKHTVLGIAQQVSQSPIDNINAEGESDTNSPSRPLPGKLDHLTLEARRHIESILIKYTHVFHDKDENYFTYTNVVEHQIMVSDSKPIRNPPYIRVEAGNAESSVKYA